VLSLIPHVSSPVLYCAGFCCGVSVSIVDRDVVYFPLYLPARACPCVDVVLFYILFFLSPFRALSDVFSSSLVSGAFPFVHGYHVFQSAYVSDRSSKSFFSFCFVYGPEIRLVCSSPCLIFSYLPICICAPDYQAPFWFVLYGVLYHSQCSCCAVFVLP